jgi:ribosome biogenesis protein UTP30
MDPKSSSVTLFVKDPQREYKDLLETSNIKFISRVVGLDKLRNKHKTFEAKRLLMKESELFLVDDRVMTEVGKALGKQFREAKKQPVTVSLVRKDLKGELERAVASTYLTINTGTSLSIKIGTTALHSPTELYDNLIALLPQLAVRLPHGGFENVQSLHIKTSTSVSLPIYNTSLDVAGRFSRPSASEVNAVEGKAAEKLVIKEAKEEKVRVRETRRIEREVEKEKREKSQKEGGSKERKERKRKLAEASEADSSIGGSVAGGKEVVEEQILALDAPITEKVVKKSKKAVVAAKEEVVEEEGAMAAPVVKVKKAKKVKA